MLSLGLVRTRDVAQGKKCDLLHGLIMFKTQCRCSGMKRVSCMVPCPLSSIEAGILYNQMWKPFLIISRIKFDQSNFISLNSHTSGDWAS